MKKLTDEELKNKLHFHQNEAYKASLELQSRKCEKYLEAVDSFFDYPGLISSENSSSGFEAEFDNDSGNRKIEISYEFSTGFLKVKTIDYLTEDLEPFVNTYQEIFPSKEASNLLTRLNKWVNSYSVVIST